MRTGLDMSAFPFVMQRFPADTPTDAEVAAMIEEQRTVLARKESFVLLVDASKMRSVSPMQRKTYADWLKDSDRLMQRYCAGTAIVVTNPVMRGALRAVLWLVTPSAPLEVFETKGDAARRCREWMYAAGLPHSEALERHVA